MPLRRASWVGVGCVFGLLSAMLAGLAHADTGPAAAGPLAVWTDNPWQALTSNLKPPANPSLATKLVAARGGIASGLVLVSGAPQPVAAKSEGLKGPGGVLPVQLRYATRKRDMGPATGAAFEGEKLADNFDLGQTQLLEALSDTPVGGDPVQAVWLTVDVPTTAGPGAYQGTLVVAGKTVDVSLLVSAFTVPPLGERRLYINAWQSPDSVAARYGVTPWSDAHFKLLEPSLKLAGRMGTNIMYVPIVGRTYYGHRTGLIFFTRKGEELVPDFSAFERYLELWTRNAGKPRLIVPLVLDVNYRGETYDPNKTVELTVRGENGVFEHAATPIYEKNAQLWRAIVEGILQRTTKAGFANYQVVLGQSNDTRTFKQVADVFREIEPALGWAAWRHVGGTIQKPIVDSGVRYALLSGCGGPYSSYSPSRGCPAYLPGPDVSIFVTPLRCAIYDSSPSNSWRLLADGVAYSNINGFGPCGLDLWPLPPKVKGRGVAWTLKSFYAMEYGPNIDRAQPTRSTVAGPQGALSTTRLEAYAEGACEAEARLCIDVALAAKKVDDTKAKAVQKARYKGFTPGILDTTEFPADWHVSLSALYDLAAEAQRAVGDKQ